MSTKPNFYKYEIRNKGRFLEAHNLLHSLLLNTPFSPSPSPTNSLSLSLVLSIRQDNRMKLFFLSTSPSSHHTTKSSKSDNRKNDIKKTNLPFHSKLKLSTSSSTKSTTSSFSEPSSISPTTVIPQRHRRSPIRNSDFPSSSSSSSSSLPPLNMFTREEISIVLHRLGADDNEDRVMPAILADGDGLISVDGIASTSIGDDDDELRAAFGVYDADGDGRISADELHCTLLMLGDCDCSVEDCRMMIDGVDSDGDGFVSFDDFVKMMAMEI